MQKLAYKGLFDQELARFSPVGGRGGGLARSWSPRSRLFTSLLLSFNTYWSTYISYYKRYSTSGKSKHDWKVPTFKYSLTSISSPGLKFVTGGRVKIFKLCKFFPENNAFLCKICAEIWNSLNYWNVHTHLLSKTIKILHFLCQFQQKRDVFTRFISV